MPEELPTDKTPPAPARFALALALVYACLVAVGLAHHEMWRDELQAWLVVRDSRSIPELLRNLKYEGHPPLWYLILSALQGISPSPVIMQVVNGIVATAAVWVMARYAPFPRLAKVLLALGYFLLYEYGAVSRSYALGVLLIFIACALFPSRRAHYLALGAALALLAHTSVLGVVLALGFAAALVVKRLVPAEREARPSDPQLAVVMGLLALGVVTAVLQIRPPTDSGIPPDWRTNFDLAVLIRTGKTFGEGLFPRFPLAVHWWNRPFTVLPGSWLLILALTAAVVIWAVAALARRPAALAFYVTATGGLLGFFYVMVTGSINHHGYFFVALVAALWLGDLRRNHPVFTGILAWQAVAGLVAMALDYRYPFSAGREVAVWLRREGLERSPLVGADDYSLAPILGYGRLNRAFYPQGERFGSFVVWDTARNAPVSDSAVVSQAGRLALKERQPVVLVLNHRLDSTVTPGRTPEPLREFTGATIWNENYYLFLVRPR